MIDRADPLTKRRNVATGLLFTADDANFNTEMLTHRALYPTFKYWYLASEAIQAYGSVDFLTEGWSLDQRDKHGRWFGYDRLRNRIDSLGIGVM